MADSDTNLNNMLLFLETIPNQSKYTPSLPTLWWGLLYCGLYISPNFSSATHRLFILVSFPGIKLMRAKKKKKKIDKYLGYWCVKLYLYCVEITFVHLYTLTPHRPPPPPHPTPDP